MRPAECKEEDDCRDREGDGLKEALGPIELSNVGGVHAEDGDDGAHGEKDDGYHGEDEHEAFLVVFCFVQGIDVLLSL